MNERDLLMIYYEFVLLLSWPRVECKGPLKKCTMKLCVTVVTVHGAVILCEWKCDQYDDIVKCKCMCGAKFPRKCKCGAKIWCRCRCGSKLKCK